ncbi:hypothetical protein RHS01_11017 [Rhizoctonia solani]|uniref:Uncharacterized protein n=1 Tax=Rhizoctonia solani TaxID=456999 RepID=A0A8H7I3X1_9AGAM|nr:hypothetical protein RHS01_11017 [Rhizoctonia solani]
MLSNQNIASSSAAFVTSALRDAAMLRRISPMRHLALFEELVQGIASTRNVFVMLGDAAMAGSGLAARSANRNRYIDYLEQLAGANSLAGCVTASIDGLEGRWSANVAAKVTGLGEAATKKLDDVFTSPPNLKPSGDDPQICQDCTRKSKEKIVKKPEVIVISNSKDSNDSGPSTQPALRSRQRMKKHIELTQTESTPQFYDGEAYLFLLVGPPPQDPEVLQLVHAFADSVHSRAGAVICLSKVPLPGTKYNYINFQLEGNLNLTFGEILRAMEQMAAMEAYGSAPPRLANSNLWFELL